jgi:hypothetical protein
MDKSYVKPCFTDMWDSYQLKVATLAGNKAFWEFMKEYQSELRPIADKYRTSEAAFYKRRMAAKVMEKEFTEKAPPRNVDEMMDKGLDMSKKAVKKGGEVLSKAGAVIDKKLNQWFN